MHPSISELVRAPLYQDLQDYPSVLEYCSREIGRVGTDKSADPLSSRDWNLGQKPYKNPFLDRFQTIIYRGSLLVSNIVLFLYKLLLIVLFLGPIQVFILY